MDPVSRCFVLHIVEIFSRLEVARQLRVGDQRIPILPSKIGEGERKRDEIGKKKAIRNRF